MFARVGEPRCPDHAEVLEAQAVSQMVDQVMSLSGDVRWMLLAPIVRGRKRRAPPGFRASCTTRLRPLPGRWRNDYARRPAGFGAAQKARY